MAHSAEPNFIKLKFEYHPENELFSKARLAC